MKHRYVILLGLVCMLVVTNLWTWEEWLRSTPKKEPSSHALIREFQISDFQMQRSPVLSEENATIKRNFFYPLFEDIPIPVTAPGEYQRAKQVVKIEEIREPHPVPQKTSEQLAEEAAQDDLARLKYVGMIFRAGQAQAYLLSADQPYFVSSGDKVGDHFVVEKITMDSVELSDPVTKVSVQIRIVPDINVNSN